MPETPEGAPRDASLPERRDMAMILQMAEALGEVRATIPQIVARVEAVEEQAARFDTLARKLDTVERQVSGVEQSLVGLQAHLNAQDSEQSSRLDAIDAKIERFQQLADMAPSLHARFDVVERSVKNSDLFISQFRSWDQHRKEHMAEQDRSMREIKKRWDEGIKTVVPLLFSLLISNIINRTHPDATWSLIGVGIVLLALFGTAGYLLVRWIAARRAYDGPDFT